MLCFINLTVGSISLAQADATNMAKWLYGEFPLAHAENKEAYLLIALQ